MITRYALIIDDNTSNNQVLTMLLQAEGVSAVALTSPRQLPDVLAQIDQVDVVFLDLEIPPYNYHDLLNQLKSEARLGGAPIVAYTVHISEIDEARRVGFDGFLGKPLNAAEFPEHLRRILSGEQVWVY
jgi:two-component system cell cycle response regulator DivK